MPYNMFAAILPAFGVSRRLRFAIDFLSVESEKSIVKNYFALGADDGEAFEGLAGGEQRFFGHGGILRCTFKNDEGCRGDSKELSAIHFEAIGQCADVRFAQLAGAVENLCTDRAIAEKSSEVGCAHVVGFEEKTKQPQ